MKRLDARGQMLAEALGVDKGDVVSLVGGGGKTTLMYRLTGELLERGLRAAAATTTKIAVPGPGEARLLCGGSLEDLSRALPGSGPGVVVLGRGLLDRGKVQGIPAEWCDRLVGEDRVDALVVEADGAARKPIKAPEAWEPVVPGATTLFVAVVGLSCVGKPLDAETAFRPERVRDVAGLPAGAPIASEVLVRLLVSPEGLLKGCPARARAVVFLNQADLPGAVESGGRVAAGVLGGTNPYEAVLIGAAGTESPVLETWKR